MKMEDFEKAYSYYKKVFNQKEYNEMNKWVNDTYYNSDGIYRLPKLDTMEEKIAFINRFKDNLTAMAWFNYSESMYKFAKDCSKKK